MVPGRCSCTAPAAFWQDRWHPSDSLRQRGGFHTNKQGSDLLQASQGQISRPTQILLDESLANPAVGVPIAIPPSSRHLACRQVTLLTLKGEGRDGVQPDEPSLRPGGEHEKR